MGHSRKSQILMHVVVSAFLACLLVVLANMLLSAGHSSDKGKSISGSITLPSTKEGGSLYVFLGTPGKTSPLTYTVSRKDSLTSNKISYEISNVPTGSVFVYAIWDIAKPYIELIDSSLLALPSEGDYMGSYKKEVVLFSESRLEDIDFPCTTLVEKMDTKKCGSDYKFVDLTYEKRIDDTNKLFLKVENTGTKPVCVINLLCIIEGEPIPFRGKGRTIEPGAAKDLDITVCYDIYDKYFRDKKVTFPKTLNFKIVSEDNEQVLKKSIVLK